MMRANVRATLWACALSLALCALSARSVLAHRGVDEQIAELDRVIGGSQASAELYLRRAELHRIHRDWDAARADYESARALAPELAAIDLAHGRMSQESGRAAEAVGYLGAFLSERPEHIDGRILRARALLALERHDEAIADYERVARAGLGASVLGPDYVLEHARALSAGGRYADALRVLDDGLARLSGHVALQLSAIDVEIRRGAYDRAFARAEHLPDARHNRPRHWARRGDIAVAAGRTEVARASYTEALAAWRAWPERRRQTGAARRLQQRVTGALVELDASRSNPRALLRLWETALWKSLGLLVRPGSSRRFAATS